MTQTPHATASAPAPVTEKEIRSVYFALMAVLGLGALDQSIVATALPRIVSDLGGMAHLSWVVTAYVLASTATMPLYGKMADQYGRRPMIFTALATFLLGSVLCGLAGSMTQLIVFRAIQRHGRRRLHAAGPDHHQRPGCAAGQGQAPGLDRHRVRRHQRARPGAGRPDDRSAVLALDLLHQPAGRRLRLLGHRALAA
jgi:hypothetical protein